MMRPIAAITGALLVIAGAVAVITGEFNSAGSWLLALGLGATGLAGMVMTVTRTISE